MSLRLNIVGHNSIYKTKVWSILDIITWNRSISSSAPLKVLFLPTSSGVGVVTDAIITICLREIGNFALLVQMQMELEGICLLGVNRV